MSFQMYPLSETVVHQVKMQMKDSFGNVLQVTKAVSDRGVCRRCLRRFQPEDKRILFKYRPFQNESVFAEAGPIYVHLFDCKPVVEILTGYPDEFRSLPLLLRGYDEQDLQQTAQLIPNGDAESIIAKFFEDPLVAYIHFAGR